LKKLITFLFLIFLTGLISGIYLQSNDNLLGDKIVGFSVVFLVVIFMPIFLYHRWNGKKLSDYTLSEENLKKMKAKSSKSIK
jgi:type III secretory pathway component EscS